MSLLCILLTDYPFLCILQTSVMHSRSSAEYEAHNNRQVLNYLLITSVTIDLPALLNF